MYAQDCFNFNNKVCIFLENLTLEIAKLLHTRVAWDSSLRKTADPVAQEVLWTCAATTVQINLENLTSVNVLWFVSEYKIANLSKRDFSFFKINSKSKVSIVQVFVQAQLIVDD